MQSGSQQQLPSQLPAVRSQMHDPAEVTATTVASGSAGTSSLHSVVEMEYTGSASVPTASVGAVCATADDANIAIASSAVKAHAVDRAMIIFAWISRWESIRCALAAGVT